MIHNVYENEQAVRQAVAEGRHRELIGGLWDDMGPRQLAFLQSQGLRPDQALLDIGCGPLRLGAVAVPWLEPGRYWGCDLSQALLDVGYRRELDGDGRARLPHRQLFVTDRFEFAAVDAPIEVAIAQSVFTHLPLNHLRRCLANLPQVMAREGVFYATFFALPEAAPLTTPFTHASPIGEPITSHDDRDPFHYRPSDLAWAGEPFGWRMELIGDWGHPRGQSMAAFRR